MIDYVDQVLKLWRSTPFVWGDADCMLSVGDYLASRGALDVTDRFRGTYADEAGAMAHVAAVGGVSALVDLTGVQRTDSPRRGDVVCLKAFSTSGATEVGGICTGAGVAARLERGIIELDLRLITIVQAWKVP